MTQYSFSDADLSELSDHEISLDEAERQIELLLSPVSYIRLNRACTLGDGIHVIESSQQQQLLDLHKEAALKGRFTKFVPASGAATRMFRDLLVFIDSRQELDDIKHLANQSNKEAQALLKFLEGVKSFAFSSDLENVLKANNLSLHDLLNCGKYKELICHLLQTKGLDYAQLPKGLLKFHSYKAECRTAFEEHLVEAVQTIADQNKKCRIHLTVSPEHLEKFFTLLESVRNTYESRYDVKYEVEFSVQKLSTDMIALGPDRMPFHDENGHILLRPGGHGALIENLNDLRADLIYIKNIDNVQLDRNKEESILYKRLLAGYLLSIQESLFTHLRGLHSSNLNDQYLEEVLKFARNTLCISIPDSKWQELSSHQARRDFLIRKLDRPLRVCGVVKNTGEPGGGPFWVHGDDGVTSLQIVEGSQIDDSSPAQSKIFYTSTHFNPVDLVCAVKGFRGQTFDLRKYVDPRAVIFTKKSYQGRDLLACERPGLWNGAMSDWITLFVEVPEATFTPVKTIIDLLRPSHL